MKKAVVMAGAFLALGVLWYVGPLSGQTQSQTNSQAAPTPARTRIAILNLTYVIKNYKKYQNFQEEIKGIVEPFHKKDTDLREKLEGLRKQAATAQGQPSEREKLEKEARDIQRQIEDNNAEVKIALGKRSDDEMKIIYNDICEAAQRYAQSHDFEMVLHYNDAVTKEDFFSAPNIGRKLQTGALMPLYFLPSMDISVAVVELLNYNMGAAAAPSASSGGH